MSAPTAGPAARRAPARAALDVRSEADVGQVIAATNQFCLDGGFPALFAAHVATAASELANNLWMHASRGGRIVLSLEWSAGTAGVALRAEDDGPGIADVGLALTEGFSTAGGLGCGLPGVRRLMDEFDIASRVGAGTCVTTRKWAA